MNKSPTLGFHQSDSKKLLTHHRGETKHNNPHEQEIKHGRLLCKQEQ